MSSAEEFQKRRRSHASASALAGQTKNKPPKVPKTSRASASALAGQTKNKPPKVPKTSHASASALAGQTKNKPPKVPKTKPKYTIYKITTIYQPIPREEGYGGNRKREIIRRTLNLTIQGPPPDPAAIARRRRRRHRRARRAAAAFLSTLETSTAGSQQPASKSSVAHQGHSRTTVAAGLRSYPIVERPLLCYVNTNETDAQLWKRNRSQETMFQVINKEPYDEKTRRKKRHSVICPITGRTIYTEGSMSSVDENNGVLSRGSELELPKPNRRKPKALKPKDK